MIKTYGLNLCAEFDFISRITSDRDIDIYIDTCEYHPNDSLKIYFQCEPNEIYPCYSYLQSNYTRYDYIMCYDTTQLQNSNNVITHLCGGTWIKDIPMHEKQYKISNLCGSKKMTSAHTQRIHLYHSQLEFTSWPITFFRSNYGDILPNINNNPFIGRTLESKIDLFKDFQFSIVIENSRERNYFSEKIVDCLITKTIPIYYGCSNIQDYFDISGWIILESNNIVDELKQKLIILNETYYSKYMDTIDYNYEKAKYHGDFINGMVDALVQIPGVQRSTK